MLGIWNVVTDPAAILAASGPCDFVIIDLEHGSRDLAQTSTALLACGANSLEAWVRVAGEADQRTQWLLDSGVRQFVLPQVRNVAQLERFALNLTFPPHGFRGTHPRRSLINVADPPRICLIVETTEAIDQLDALLSCEKVNAVYFGAYDLAQQLGLPLGPLDPALRSIFADVANRVRQTGREVVAMPNANLSVDFLSAHGTSAFVLGIDESLLVSSIQQLAASYEGVSSSASQG